MTTGYTIHIGTVGGGLSTALDPGETMIREVRNTTTSPPTPLVD
jgi:hypothetical protein